MTIYLDHNATTVTRPSVISLMAEVMGETGNASSVHQSGQRARRRVETARRQIGKALCARPEDIVFTGTGTEALNLALSSLADGGETRRLIVSSIEHEAVAETAQQTGLEIEIWPVNAAGAVELDWLADRLKRWTKEDGVPALALMRANNEIGTLQPVAQAAAMIREHGGRVVMDAIQAVGKVPLDLAEIGADYVALAGHKFGGPQGSGALVMACHAPLKRQIHGGGQESNRRAGTLNVAGIAGLGLAVEEAVAQLDAFQSLADKRDRIEMALRQLGEGIRILGQGAERLPNTLGVAVAGWRGETQVMAMDLAGVAISAGSACSSGKARSSKMGTALDLPAEMADGVVRISLGRTTTDAEVDAFIAAYREAHARIRPARLTDTHLTDTHRDTAAASVRG